MTCLNVKKGVELYLFCQWSNEHNAGIPTDGRILEKEQEIESSTLTSSQNIQVSYGYQCILMIFSILVDVVDGSFHLYFLT
jgi:hypothetical protein